MVKLGGTELVARTLYRPPDSSIDFVKKLNDLRCNLRVFSEKVIRAGDFDPGGINWNSPLGVNCDVAISSASQDMVFSDNATSVLKMFTWVEGSHILGCMVLT